MTSISVPLVGGESQLPSPIARGHGRVAPDRGGWVQVFQVGSAQRSKSRLGVIFFQVAHKFGLYSAGMSRGRVISRANVDGLGQRRSISV